VIDATDMVVGRLAAQIAPILMGKHRPTYTPHIDTGDFVIIINAEKAVLTGRKEEQKIYHYHTGYPGGIKSEPAAKLRQRRPTKMLEEAVWGMLPKNRLGRKQLKKLKVYAGGEHPHQAQQPEVMNVAEAI
jgi:large subunit ribosomal protein L13